MKKTSSSKRARRAPKGCPRLPDLDHAKAAVLNSLTWYDAQRGYRRAIDEFVNWYCSEPRLAFNKTVVLRYRVHIRIPEARTRNDQPTSQRGTPSRHSQIRTEKSAVRRQVLPIMDHSQRNLWGPPAPFRTPRAAATTRLI